MKSDKKIREPIKENPVALARAGGKGLAIAQLIAAGVMVFDDFPQPPKKKEKRFDLSAVHAAREERNIRRFKLTFTSERSEKYRHRDPSGLRMSRNRRKMKGKQYKKGKAPWIVTPFSKPYKQRKALGWLSMGAATTVGMDRIAAIVSTVEQLPLVKAAESARVAIDTVIAIKKASTAFLIPGDPGYNAADHEQETVS